TARVFEPLLKPCRYKGGRPRLWLLVLPWGAQVLPNQKEITWSIIAANIAREAEALNRAISLKLVTELA
ncbi:MAG TPA: hypothetical protein VFJ49_04350, partial [Methyloceanibacter sp.]|nr:hypothetical protein [Methyloceanibacter sp.]